MKKPMPAPQLPDMAGWLTNPRFLELFARADVSVAEQPYLHWDELRYRKPPSGLSHEEWWLVTKLARQSMRRFLPLVDKDGNAFTYVLPDVILRESEFVSTHARGRISLSEQVTNPATRDRYLVSSLIEEAITSSQLEGASTTRKVAKDMIRSGRPPKDRSERMILNNYVAMRRIGDLRDHELTPELICEVHRIVTEGTLEDPDAAGRFQLPGEERVGVYDGQNNLLFGPPPAGELPERMAALCEFGNADDGGSYLPGVLRALTIHFMIGYNHPFEDGNGRTARALFYWSMLNRGYWLTEFLSLSRILKKAYAKYARSFLFTETDGGDLTYFYVYHLAALHRAVDDLNDYLARKAQEVRELRIRLAKDYGHFNSRQVALLTNALKNPDSIYSVKTHMTSHQTSMETARQDLVALVAEGLLEQDRVGQRHIYRPAVDLAQRIKVMGDQAVPL